MRTIHKFPLNGMEGPQPVQMPRYAIPRGVALQGTSICIWAEVDTDQPHEERTFAIVGTGHPLPDGQTARAAYLGMVQQGPSIWHVVEL